MAAVMSKSNEHYLTVLRYVERNPLRANMVPRSQDWEWSGLKPTTRSNPARLLHDGPNRKRAQWTRHVNGVETEAELKALQHSLTRGTPAGDTHWQTKTAALLGLQSSLRPRGRPKQLENQNVPVFDSPGFKNPGQSDHSAAGSNMRIVLNTL